MVRNPGFYLLGLFIATSSAACVTTGQSVRPSPFPGASSRALATAPGALSTTGSAVLAAVVDTALAQRGIPYRFGGELPETGFDCSGLVRFAFSQHQITVPRTVEEQARIGQGVDRSNATSGDLVFFSTTAPGPTHVGVLIDSETFVHAPDAGGIVRTERLDTPYWRTRVTGIRRLDDAWIRSSNY